MKKRLVVALLLLGCGTHEAKVPRRPANRAAVLANEPRCQPTTLEGEGELLLGGIDPDVREAIERRIRSQSVAVLHLERKNCNVEIEVLTCTRPVKWSGPNDPHSGSGQRMLVPALLDARSVAGAGNLYVDAKAANHVAVIFDRMVDRALEPRWGDTRGPSEDSIPPLSHAELRGSDCDRANAWVMRLHLGNLSVLGGPSLDGPWSENRIDRSPLVSMQYHALRDPPKSIPSAFPKPTAYPPTQCPAPAAGQPTMQMQMAQRLFDRQTYGDAFAALQRVAQGETGDDPGSQEQAAYLSGVALGELGLFTEAELVMTSIATSPCHLRKAEAAFWLTIRDHRKTF